MRLLAAGSKCAAIRSFSSVAAVARAPLSGSAGFAGVARIAQRPIAEGRHARGRAAGECRLGVSAGDSMSCQATGAPVYPAVPSRPHPTAVRPRLVFDVAVGIVAMWVEEHDHAAVAARVDARAIRRPAPSMSVPRRTLTPFRRGDGVIFRFLIDEPPSVSWNWLKQSVPNRPAGGEGRRRSPLLCQHGQPFRPRAGGSPPGGAPV